MPYFNLSPPTREHARRHSGYAYELRPVTMAVAGVGLFLCFFHEILSLNVLLT